MNMINSH